MKTGLKKLLRFYYFADGLNGALDGIILRLGVTSWREEAGDGASFNKITKVIEAKRQLAVLWARLDGVMSALTERDGRVLKAYAAARSRVCESVADRRELHRALVKFSRRAGGIISDCGKAYECVCSYYCFLNPTCGE